MDEPNETQYRPGVVDEAGTTISRKSRASVGSDLATIFKIAEQAAGSVRAELMGEIKALAAAIREGETNRSADVDRLTTALSTVPNANDIRRTIIITTAWGIGTFLVVAGLFVAIFDIGASVAGSFGDDVVDIKEQQQIVDKRFDDVEGYLRNLQESIDEQRQPDSNEVQPPVEGNVAGRSP